MEAVYETQRNNIWQIVGNKTGVPLFNVVIGKVSEIQYDKENELSNAVLCTKPD